MKVIFECETEIGKCEDMLVNDPAFFGDSCEPWTIYAHTAASLTGSKRMLKIEERCYLRRGEDIPDQSWVKPEIILEPMLASEAETVVMVRRVHEQFILKVRERFPEDCLAAM